MKKKTVVLFLIFFSVCINATAADLIEVYKQALISDPVFQQALAQRLSDKENVPINMAALFPTAMINITPSTNKYVGSGPGNVYGNYSTRAIDHNLTVTQTLFDFGRFAALSGAHAISKQADARLNAAVQSLMMRVAIAYFAVLNNEDNVRFNKANKKVYAKQLSQIKQQYKVRLKTMMDVYMASAAYDMAEADDITAQMQLQNARENLRVITGKEYPHLAKLSETFPLISPQPANVDSWVETAIKQNWSIKASQYAEVIALQQVKQQQAGHYPTLQAKGIYDFNTVTSTGGIDPLILPPGASQTHTRTAELVLSIPIFEGGLVVSKTRQAQHDYQVISQQLEQTIRNTVNTTRQSYVGVVSSISKIHADKQVLKSSLASYQGLRAAYKVGTQMVVDVLNQQQKVFNAFKQYAYDRYTYINNLLALKQAAGTLSPDDLASINAWLSKE